MQALKPLKEYLPEYWWEISEMVQLLKTEDAEFAKLYDSGAKIQANLFLKTMDVTSIARMEKLLNIAGISGKPLEERRQMVLFKFHPSKLSATEIQSIFQFFGGPTTDIWFNNSTIYITFFPFPNLISNLDNLKKIILQRKPAHLDVVFFPYLIWNVWDSYNLTFDQLDAMNVTWNDIDGWLGIDPYLPLI